MFTVRLAGADEAPLIIEMLRELIPAADPAARYAWLYANNPAGHALTWLAVDDASGQVAGLTSFFPWRLWLDGAPVLGALGGDGYVRPAFRRRGLGQTLHAASRAAMRAHGIRCMYGAPGAMNVTPLEKGGSRHIADAVRWVRPMSGRALGVRSSLADRAIAALLRPRLARAELQPMRRFDPRVDQVWAQTKGELALAAVRDAPFYTWRFLDAPAGKQTPYVIVRRGRPLAVCALEQLDGALRIVDLLAPRRAWGAALRAIAGGAGGERIIDVRLLAPDGARRLLWRWGYVAREGKPYLVMAPEGDERSPVLDPARWFFTGADSDLDSVAD